MGEEEAGVEAVAGEDKMEEDQNPEEEEDHNQEDPTMRAA